MQHASAQANRFASNALFSEHLAIKSPNTIRSQLADLKRFAFFLSDVGVTTDGTLLQTNPAAWQGVEWGLIKAFVNWQLKEGYAVQSVNRALSTVKTYAKMASQAGAISAEALVLIQSVRSYGRKEGKRIDARRKVARVGDKKEHNVKLSVAQAEQLKRQPDTPQGIRDTLLMCILLDLGLRVSEVELLTRDAFDLGERTVTFFRPKVDLTQTQAMTDDIYNAAVNYLPYAPHTGVIWRGSLRGGELCQKRSLKKRAIFQRVKLLGNAVGAYDISPHDCRHYWATAAARSGTPIERLREAGGWSSLAMPMRYIEATRIANQGVLLPNRKPDSL